MRQHSWLTLIAAVAVVVVGIVVAVGLMWAAMNRPAEVAEVVRSADVNEVVEDAGGVAEDIGATLDEVAGEVTAPDGVRGTPTASGNRPPSTPTTAQPAQVGAVTAITLTWQGGDPDGDAVTYRVFLEADDPTPDVLVAEQAETTYEPGELRPGTTYYWQVQAVDARGAATAGPVWQFTTTSDTPSFAAQVVALTNDARAEAGCPPLAGSERLMAAAEAHSRDMAENDYLSHTGADGSTPWNRIEATGYEFSLAAENVAGGPPTPELVVAGWMASEEHRANILNCDLTDIGVGYIHLPDDAGDAAYQHYWTQDFATPR